MKIGKLRKAVAIFSLSTTLGLSGIAYANPAYHSMGNISQEQATKAQELAASHSKAMAPLVQQLNTKQMELDSQLNSATIDMAKIETLSKDIGALQGQIYASDISFNAQLMKEGLPSYGCQERSMGYGSGHRGGHGSGHGGGHNGWMSGGHY